MLTINTIITAFSICTGNIALGHQAQSILRSQAIFPGADRIIVLTLNQRIKYEIIQRSTNHSTQLLHMVQYKPILRDTETHL